MKGNVQFCFWMYIQQLYVWTDIIAYVLISFVAVWINSSFLLCQLFSAPVPDKIHPAWHTWVCSCAYLTAAFKFYFFFPPFHPSQAIFSKTPCLFIFLRHPGSADIKHLWRAARFQFNIITTAIEIMCCWLTMWSQKRLPNRLNVS